MKKFLQIIIITFLFLFYFYTPIKTNAANGNVTGTVFIDTNQNTNKDLGEQGYNGATVNLLDRKFTPVLSVSSDENGNYSIPISGLSGTYYIGLTLPNGYTETGISSININDITNFVQNFGIIAIPNNPLLTQYQNLALQGVTCPESNGITCIAIGADGAGTSSIWTTVDGITWSNTTINVNDLSHMTLRNIICPNTNGIFCITVGQGRYDSLGNNDGVILTSKDGINWENTSFLNSNIGDDYSSIACPNIHGVFCIAVSLPNTSSSSYISTTTDGKNWKLINNPSFPNIYLYDIKCPNSNGILCIAVGYDPSNQSSVILTTSDLTNWNREVSGTSNVTLDEVSCPNANGIFCITVGYDRTNNTDTGVILKTTDGVNWTSESNFENDIDFKDIECPKTNGIFCIVVGSSNVTSSIARTILTTTDGINWTNSGNWTSISGLVTHNINLNSVSCTNSQFFCVAVGSRSFSSIGGGVILKFPPTPQRQVVFVHGLNSSYKDVEDKKAEFSSLIAAVPPQDRQVFAYYQDKAYLNNSGGCTDTSNNPQPTPDTKVSPLFVDPNSNNINPNICDSQSDIAYNSTALDDFIEQKITSPAAIINYSMGAPITRGWLTLAQSKSNDSTLNKVDTIISIQGAQKGTWLAAPAPELSNSQIWSAPIWDDLNILANLYAIHLLPFRPAIDDLRPQSLWYINANNTNVPSNMHYYNFYSNMQLNPIPVFLFHPLQPLSKVPIGDSVLLPGDPNPIENLTPEGGARFLPGGVQTTDKHEYEIKNDYNVSLGEIYKEIFLYPGTALGTALGAIFQEPLSHIKLTQNNLNNNNVLINSCKSSVGLITIQNEIIRILDNPAQACD